MFNHVIVSSNDIKRLKRFYEALLGTLGAGEPGIYTDTHGYTWEASRGARRPVPLPLALHESRDGLQYESSATASSRSHPRVGLAAVAVPVAALPHHPLDSRNEVRYYW
jgi:hypothetical protein